MTKTLILGKCSVLSQMPFLWCLVSVKAEWDMCLRLSHQVPFLTSNA